MTFSSFNGGFSCWASRVSPRRATHFSLLRQRKVSKRKATQVRVSLRCATGNLRCSQQAGRMQTRYAQTCILLDPPVAALLGTRTWVEREQNTRAGEAVGRSVSFFETVSSSGSSGCLFPAPLGRAEQRSVGRIRAGACLSAASLRQTPPNVSSAGNPAGARSTARLLFAYFLLAKQEKVSRPPGRDPASHARKNTTQKAKTKC
jgi:hypothetical protein